MRKNGYFGLGVSAMLLILESGVLKSSPHSSSADAIAPQNMPRIGTVDDRFQSYNIEMVEVTGGRFWKPYKDIGATSQHPGIW